CCVDTKPSLQATARSVAIQKNNKKMLKTSIFTGLFRQNLQFFLAMTDSLSTQQCQVEMT
ncbi:MAG: hypothetical protein AB8U43_03030, partial [Rickettsia aeschlimannii]